jgi:hypothetical protein
MDDPLGDTEPQYSSPTPSSPYDSDAYNTANARIHFGPLRSPEKKFVPMVGRPSTLRPGPVDSPLRRSPRLSSPRPRSPFPATVVVLREDEGASVEVDDRASEDVGFSRVGTPDNEQFLQDGTLDLHIFIAVELILKATQNHRLSWPTESYEPTTIPPHLQTPLILQLRATHFLPQPHLRPRLYLVPTLSLPRVTLLVQKVGARRQRTEATLSSVQPYSQTPVQLRPNMTSSPLILFPPPQTRSVM